MNLTLKRFYQAVDLANPEQVTYYLVFLTDAGKEILLPVQKETTEALVKMLYAQEAPAQKPLTFQEDVGHEDDADEFAAEEDQEEKTAEEAEEPEDPGEGFDDTEGFGDGEDGDLEDLEPRAPVPAPRPVAKVPPHVMTTHKQRAPIESEDEVPSL